MIDGESRLQPRNPTWAGTEREIEGLGGEKLLFFQLADRPLSTQGRFVDLPHAAIYDGDTVTDPGAFIGQTVSHYRIHETIAVAAWVFIRLRIT